MGKQLKKDLIREVMAAMGSKGGKMSLQTMTAEERSLRAKKASLVAAEKRTAKRLAAERTKQSTRVPKPPLERSRPAKPKS